MGLEVRRKRVSVHKPIASNNAAGGALREDVEQRRLAGPVRADDHPDLVRIDVERDVVDRLEPVEGDGERLDRQEVVGRGRRQMGEVGKGRENQSLPWPCGRLQMRRRYYLHTARVRRDFRYVNVVEDPAANCMCVPGDRCYFCCF